MKVLGLATLVFVLGTIALTACTSGSASLEGKLWQLISYLGADGQMMQAMPEVKTTAAFTDGQVGGNAACNSYSGPYEVNGDKIEFGMIASTMMACPEPVMNQEIGYLGALEQAATIEVTEDGLRMFNANGEVVLEFAPIEPASLTGTNWLLTSYNNGRGGMQSPVIGSEITADFSEDGRLSGSAGCNNYNASYEASEETISIGVTASTEMACMDPEGVMDQEVLYLAALQNSAVYSIQDDRLEIRDENGSGVAYFIAIP
jgi:heat shock protein HslJ